MRDSGFPSPVLESLISCDVSAGGEEGEKKENFGDYEQRVRNTRNLYDLVKGKKESIDD